MPYFRKWKLQPNKIPTPEEQWECTKQVLFSHFTIELPAVSLVATSLLGFTHGEALDLVVPSYGRNVGYANVPSAFPGLEDDSPASRHFLRV